MKFSRRLKAFANAHAWLFFLAPAFCFYTLFWIIPAVGSFAISLTHWNGISWQQMRWAGLSNYVELIDDGFFWVSLKNNLIFVGFAVVAILTVALTIAIALSLRPRGYRLFETVFFLPTILSSIVIGLVFGLIISPTSGLLPVIGESIHLSGVADVQLLGNKDTATFTVLSVYVWQQIGFSILIIGAGVRAVASDYIDAARIDGASPLKIVRYIMLPLTKDVLVVALVLVVINAFLLFDLVFIMTGGGPFHASEVLSTYMYQQAFALGRTSYGSAIAVVLFVIVLAVSAAQLSLTGFGRSK